MNQGADSNIVNIQISTGTILKIISLILLFVVLYMVRHIVALFLFAVVVASAIEPIAHWANRYRVPRIITVLSIYIAVFALLSLVFYFLMPPLFSEFLTFIGSLSLSPAGSERIHTIFGLAPNLPETLTGTLNQALTGLQGFIEKSTAGFFKTASDLVGGALSFALVIIISFYLAVQEHGIEKFLQIITPRQYEGYVLDLWLRSQQKIGRWLQGQVLLGVLVGVLVFLGLTILGIKYALMLAILATIFELIPIFGPVLAAIPAVGIAFIQSPSLALAVVALYVIIQQFESHLIYPVVVRKIVGVPSILVILAMIVGGTLAGLWGLLLAIPVASILIEILNDFVAGREGFNTKKQSV